MSPAGPCEAIPALGEWDRVLDLSPEGWLPEGVRRVGRVAARHAGLVVWESGETTRPEGLLARIPPGGLCRERPWTARRLWLSPRDVWVAVPHAPLRWLLFGVRRTPEGAFEVRTAHGRSFRAGANEALRVKPQACPAHLGALNVPAARCPAAGWRCR